MNKIILPVLLFFIYVGTLSARTSFPPTATTYVASSITAYGATLNGILIPNKESPWSPTSTMSFDYGTSSSYGTNVTATPGSVTGYTDTPVSCTITGLTPNTTYHYRIKATGEQGAVGADLTFTTLAGIPTITSFTPTTGTTGTTVKIIGTNFSTIPAENIVNFGAVKATVSEATAESLTLTVPEEAGSVVPLSVSVNGKIAYSATCSTPYFHLINSPTLSLSYALKITNVGENPNYIISGDYNGDGKSDLVTANNSGTLSVLLGNGDGTFNSYINYNLEGVSFCVASGDFNGDGILDLVSPNATTNSLCVFIGKGDGTFKDKADYSVGDYPVAVTVGDFNHDGHADLVVCNQFSNDVSILLGTGTGTFGTKTDFVTGEHPLRIAAGDFNGDNKADLAVVNYRSFTLSILIGKGDGTFNAKTDYSVGRNPESVAIGDFNGDGKSDIVTANCYSDDVSVLLGDGTGAMGTKTNYYVGQYIKDVVIGDFDGDMKIDVATANWNTNDISILPGKGDGTFDVKRNCVVENNPHSLVVGDFNGDGKADIISANFDANNISILTYTPTQLTTQNATSIRHTTSTVISNLTSLGDAKPIQHGVIWSTSQYPKVVLNTKTELGETTEIGEFTSLITGLSPNTTYYVRAYATISDGTVYGNQVIFKTGANKVWTGLANSDWDLIFNWVNFDVPTTNDNVEIPNVENDPVIGALSRAEIINLDIKSGATLTFESTESSTGQLKVIGTTTNDGNIILKKTFSPSQGWYFLSLPFDVSAENIKILNKQAAVKKHENNESGRNINALDNFYTAKWGDPFGEAYNTENNFYLAEYNGAARAAAGVNYTANSPFWINVTDKSKMVANKGYVMIVENEVNLYFISETGTINPFSATDISLTVRVDEGSSSFNNSWNLSGMPYLSEFNINHLNQANFLYFYNQETATYDVMEKNTSDFYMNPFQSFFFQADNIALTFAKAGMLLRAKSATTLPDYSEATLQISNGTYSDLTRIRLQEGANPEYVINEDAAKFFSLNNEVPQLWTSAEGYAVSVNGLPAETPEAGLIVKTVTPGYYSIGLASRPTNSTPSTLLLFDKYEGKTTDLLSGNYNYLATSGTNTDRFKILFAPGVTTKTDHLNGWKINAHNLSFSIKGLESKNQVKVYDSKGVLIELTENGKEGQIVYVPAHGVYIIQIKSGEKSEKIKLIL